MPQSSPKGHLNPEFIGEDDDDNDIYKAQLLLFLKQSHLIRPNIYPDEQDNKSDASDYSGKNSRKVSAVSTASDKNQEYNDEPTVEIQSAQDPDNLSAVSCSYTTAHTENSLLSSLHPPPRSAPQLVVLNALSKRTCTFNPFQNSSF